MSVRVSFLAFVYLACLNVSSRADIFRWDNGQLIPGTEGIQAAPLVDLSNWNGDSHNLQYADFSANLDLSGAFFFESWLDDADFQGANLSNANLAFSTLTNANLSGTTVAWADFSRYYDVNTNEWRGTGLTSVQLQTTASYLAKNLQGIYLSGNDLTGGNFSSQNLSNAYLDGSTLTQANLSGANLINAVFNRSILTEANLSGATVTGATFKRHWDGQQFLGTGLSQAQLKSTSSYETKNLQGIGLNGNDMNGWDFNGQNLSNATLDSTTLTNANLNGANLSNASLDSSTLNNVKLSGAVVTGADFGATTSRGFTEAQLASTASYQAKNLQGIQLDDNDLTAWDFGGQNLSNASLLSVVTNTNLSGALVAGASFSTSRGFTEVQLASTASYQAKDLRGISLGGDLNGWNLSGQNLSNANLSYSTLNNATLSGAVVTGVHFSNTTSGGFTEAQLASTASYQQRNLTGVNLSLNDLIGWDFIGQNLTNADLSQSTLTQANLSGANLTDAKLVSSTLTNVNLSGANLTAARLDFAILTNTNLSGADLTGANLRATTLTNTNLSGALLAGADLSDTPGFTFDKLASTASYQAKNLAGIQLWKNDLTGWDLSGQNLNGARLEISKLADAILSDANLSNVNLSSSTLTNANLSGANLRNANLGQTSYAGLITTGAVYNQWTVVPDGFDPITSGLTLSPSSVGDLDASDSFDIADVDMFQLKILYLEQGWKRRRNVNQWWLPNAAFDMNQDDAVSRDDLALWIHELKHSYMGDANLDGEFNSSDLVQVFAAGKYEVPSEVLPFSVAIISAANWSTGDWNTDGEFTTSDLVAAFQDGGYEAGPRPVAVPEPSFANLFSMIGITTLLWIIRHYSPKRRYE